MGMTKKKLFEIVQQHSGGITKDEFLALLNSAIDEFIKRTKARIVTITGDEEGTSDEQALVTVADTLEYSLPDDCISVLEVFIDDDPVEENWLMYEDTDGKSLKLNVYPYGGYNIKVHYIASYTTINHINATDANGDATTSLPYTEYWDYYKYYILSDMFVGVDNKRSAAYNAKKERRLKEAVRYYNRRAGYGANYKTIPEI